MVTTAHPDMPPLRGHGTATATVITVLRPGQRLRTCFCCSPWRFLDTSCPAGNGPCGVADEGCNEGSGYVARDGCNTFRVRVYASVDGGSSPAVAFSGIAGGEIFVSLVAVVLASFHVDFIYSERCQGTIYALAV